jgi:hypothetical protein
MANTTETKSFELRDLRAGAITLTGHGDGAVARDEHMAATNSSDTPAVRPSTLLITLTILQPTFINFL